MEKQNKEKVYTLLVQGERIVVAYEVYRAYYQITEHERYLQKKARSAEYSYEEMKERGISFEFNSGYTAPSPEECLLCQIKQKALYDALNQLEPEQKRIVIGIYIDDKTESELAKEFGICQAALHKRKKKILRTLRDILTD